MPKRVVRFSTSADSQPGGLAEKWYAFQDAATKEALRGWCLENGIPVQAG